ncbi:MAG: winged helix-turn-helix domain-containing protein [Phycisphaeraceae bacterium]
MKKDDVKIGETYRAKVTDKVVPVRIDAEHPSGGWQATNLVTSKKVRIKSAQRLRGPASTADRAKTKKPAKKKLSAAELKARHKADQENARLRDERKASPDGMTKSERAMTQSATDAKPATPEAKPRRKRSGPSLIDAAITVLRDAEGPLTCSQMIEAIFERKLWSSSGKTPAATLYSAILREIQKKGDASRFAHVDRGQFALTSAADAQTKEG